MNAITTSPLPDRSSSRLTTPSKLANHTSNRKVDETLQSINSPSSSARSYQQRLRLPFPVAVELRNVFPNLRTTPWKKWYRQEYSTNLLHAVLIEIVVNDPANGETGPTTTERIVYRSTKNPPTLCPSWSHLHDRISYADLSNAAYESLKVRFFTVPQDCEFFPAIRADEPPQYFLELHLHPSRLCRVASVNMDLLPLNCVLVRFSDQTLRVHPTHYPLLDSKLTQTIPHGIDDPNSKKALSPISSHSLAGLNANGSFFEDDVFNALDPPAVPSQNEIIQDALMLFRDIPSDTLLLPESDDPNVISGSTGAADQSRLDGAASPHASTAVSVMENGNVEVVSDDDDIFGLNHPPYHESCDRDSLSLMTIEIETLQQQIDLESAALRKEQEHLDQSNVRLQTLMDHIRVVDDQNAQMEAAIQSEVINAGKAQFVMEAQQIRLMRDLSFIYPITVQGDRHYHIRGLEIPTDFYTGLISDEVIAAAFGFLCHLTSLTSKYLGLHIRYKLHCQSSRSAIQDEHGNTYPLFPGRHLDREHFEYGVQLLSRNIDCLCKGRNITIPSNMHVLGKVLRIYENVNEGY